MKTTIGITVVISGMAIVVGAILIMAGNHIGDYMVVTGAIVGTVLTHKL